MNSISVIIPVFNEEENIRELFVQLKKVLSSLEITYEIIYVDDGSQDKTNELLIAIQNDDEHVKIIRHARNQGQAKAFLSGFKQSKGDVIITLDGDLQNDPDDIPVLLNKIDDGFDIVSGWRYVRKDSLSRKIISRISNKVISAKTGVKLRDFGCALNAVRRELIEELERLLEHREGVAYLKPMLVTLASSVAEVKVNHRPRISGRSHYNIFSIMTHGICFIISSRCRKASRNSVYLVSLLILSALLLRF